MINRLKQFSTGLSDEVIAVIDIGDINICCMVYKVKQHNLYNLLTVQSMPCGGFIEGVVSDIRKATECLSKIISNAEKVSKTRIRKVLFVSPYLGNIKKLGYKNSVNKVLTQKDINTILDATQYEKIIEKENFITSVDFSSITVDGNKINNLKGVYAKNIQINLTIQSIAKQHVFNLHKILDYLSLECIGIFHKSVAIPYFFDTKYTGNQIVIDIDAYSTLLSVYKNKSVMYFNTLSTGLRDIFNGIAHQLGVSKDTFRDINIYGFSFLHLRGKFIEIGEKNNHIKVSYDDFYNSLATVLADFFNKILVVLPNNTAIQESNLNIIGECSNLLMLNQVFTKQLNNNMILKEQLLKESSSHVLSLENIGATSVLKYYIANVRNNISLMSFYSRMEKIIYKY